MTRNRPLASSTVNVVRGAGHLCGNYMHTCLRYEWHVVSGIFQYSFSDAFRCSRVCSAAVTQTMRVNCIAGGGRIRVSSHHLSSKLNWSRSEACWCHLLVLRVHGVISVLSCHTNAQTQPTTNTSVRRPLIGTQIWRLQLSSSSLSQLSSSCDSRVLAGRYRFEKPRSHFDVKMLMI